jgi:hypothetical protein
MRSQRVSASRKDAVLPVAVRGAKAARGLMGLAATQDTQPIALAPGAATGLREYRAGSDQAPRAKGNCRAEGSRPTAASTASSSTEAGKCFGSSVADRACSKNSKTRTGKAVRRFSNRPPGILRHRRADVTRAAPSPSNCLKRREVPPESPNHPINDVSRADNRTLIALHDGIVRPLGSRLTSPG